MSSTYYVSRLNNAEKETMFVGMDVDEDKELLTLGMVSNSFVIVS